MMVKQPATAKPPHHLSLDVGVIVFTRIASHIYDLSLPNRQNKFHFLGRIEQKSDSLWAVTYIGSQSCLPEYFEDWQQAALFLTKVKNTEILPFNSL
jgi:hypothetical protein